MIKFEYCKPISAKAVPTGLDWIHEVKYDGYRGRVARDGRNVKLLSKSGLDWTWRFPFIVETALKMRQTRFIIDGEICVLNVQGISDFDALHSNRHNEKAQLYAFDLVALDGDDLRDMPLFERKARLGKLLKGRPKGIFVAPHEAGEIGPGLFEAACRMGLEGLVSKHRERRYRPRTCDWIKVKNRKHPAFSRVMDTFG
ncbi:DNA ligase [Bradyrhizobium sp. AUGA SZCCT0240]|uniref:ATP-dependent DNA ligase n=1 Tax=unclassified Bradyrhizobium TaxID=2631580 RepID=UPI001BAE18C2|nr:MULTISPECIES: RNA ligase family protein [unclassified Bradyrhizobium]MBR1196618.1 DNA ligase [Bradyrhizobium sp. AUGA SZCCT0158]MBR1242366.1 DNA ligase [Bradyrhizobium sp. AUGA SZCCT0274]MBR1257146.1 DNA ligase [Bradyrhizobium sp. AUGA SZCCT0240]